MELFLVEAHQQQLQLLFEIVAILVRIEQRRAEGFHLAGVVAAADAHDDSPVGDDVGHGVVFRQPDRVPHRQHVERAAELQALGLRGQPQAELHQVRQAFITLALEVVFRGPQRIS